MISLSTVFAVCAAICLIPPLYRGAIQDLKEFRFSKEHFNSLWVNGAIIFLVLMYLSFLNDGVWIMILWGLATSIILSVVFSVIGYRRGSGGDWRALMYIAWIAPFLLLDILISIGICAVLQAGYWLIREDSAHPFERKIPFAVSILIGYVIGIVLFIVA